MRKQLDNEKQLYNPEIKERFIQTYQPDTQKNVRHVLSRAYDLEVETGKDLYDFSYNDFDALFESFRGTSLAALISVKSIVSSYVKFATEEGYVKTKFNFASMFRGKELEKYVRKAIKDNQYITDINELHNIERKCANAQDSVIFYLLYEGVKDVEELRHIKKTDFNANTKVLKLVTEREIVVSDKTAELIKEAINESEYWKANGTDTTSKTPILSLANTEYLLRPTGKNRTGMISSKGINRRVKEIASYNDNPYLNMKNIWISGQIYIAKKMKKELGRDLRQAEYETINEMFGYDKSYWFTTKRRIASYI